MILKRSENENCWGYLRTLQPQRSDFQLSMAWSSLRVCIYSVLSASIGSVFPARIAGLRIATRRGASRTSKDAR